MMMRTHAKCLQAIIDLTVDGVTPSYDEIAQAMGVSSKSIVGRTVDILVASGHLRRLPTKARALEVLDTQGMLPTRPAPVAGPIAPKGDNFRIVLGAEARTAFVGWYASAFRATASDLRRLAAPE